MIHVIDDIYIEVDSMNYIAKVDRHTTSIDKKTNQERENYDIIGYYNALEGALKGCRDYCVRKSLGEGEMTLSEALQRVSDITYEFEQNIYG